MNRKPIYVGLGVLGALLLLVGGFFALFEYKLVTEVAPPHAEARYNRFFALNLTLDQLGLPARSLTTLDPRKLALKPGDTLLIGDDVGRVDIATAARLNRWVRAGGHLILVPGPASAVHMPLFDALQVMDPRSAAFACSALHPIGATAHQDHDDVQLCGSRFRLRASATAVDAAIGDAQDGYLFARSPLGNGTLSLVASFNPISRDHLKHVSAQQFAWRLLAPNRGKGTVYLVYALDGPSFLTFIAIRGWPALLALAALLAAWMAMRSARLGPLMAAPALHRRALLEHVQAAGEFLYRRDAGRSLHRLVCQMVVARLRRRDPACVMLNGAALYARLAERGELDAAQIAQAFQSPANATAFRASIITLARLRSRP